jgi:hypothetical protein
MTKLLTDALQNGGDLAMKNKQRVATTGQRLIQIFEAFIDEGYMLSCAIWRTQKFRLIHVQGQHGGMTTGFEQRHMIENPQITFEPDNGYAG